MGRSITEDRNPEVKVTLSTFINADFDIDADLERYCKEIGIEYQEVDLNLHKIAVFITFFKG